MSEDKEIITGSESVSQEESAGEFVKKKKQPKNRRKEEITREKKRWLFFGIPWTFTKYILTKKKIIIEMGLFNSTENEILMYRVTDMTLTRSFWQKVFGLGTLIVYAHDKTTPTLEIKNIKHVREFKETLSEAVEKDRLRMKMRQSEIVDDMHGIHDDFDDFDDNTDN